MDADKISMGHTKCINCSLDDSYAEIPDQLNANILIGIFLVVDCISIPGNGLFIGYMVYHRKQMSIHDIFIMNLSFSDFFYLISLSWNILPVVLPNVTKPIFSRNNFLCRLMFSSFALSFLVNIELMAASALASYWKINNSVIKLTNSRAWKAVFGAYTLSILILSLPTIGVWARITYFHGIGVCMIDFSPTIDTNHIIFLFLIIFPTLSFTAGVTAFCYYRIYRIVRRSSKVIAHHHQQDLKSYAIKHGQTNNKNIPGERKSYSRRDISLAKTLVVIFVLFVLSYAPYAIAHLLHFFKAVNLTFTQAQYLLIISCLNSIFNPIIFYSRRRRMARYAKAVKIKQYETGTTIAMRNLDRH